MSARPLPLPMVSGAAPTGWVPRVRTPGPIFVQPALPVTAASSTKSPNAASVPACVPKARVPPDRLSELLPDLAITWPLLTVSDCKAVCVRLPPPSKVRLRTILPVPPAVAPGWIKACAVGDVVGFCSNVVGV